MKKQTMITLALALTLAMPTRSASSLQQEEQRRTFHCPGFRDLPIYRLSDLLYTERQGCYPHPVLWYLRR